MSVQGMVKLDWISFTFPITLLGEKDNEYTLSHVLSAFHEHTGQRLLSVVEGSLWTWVQSAGFYTHKIQHPNSLICLSWNAGNPFALCEISGQAIDHVLQSVTVTDLAIATNQRATRIDVAVDFETEEKPEAFTALRDNPSIRAYAFYSTETGDTCYVGSRKSDRMARVYRYNPPHPRSHLLRVEVEMKGDAAKIMASQLQSTSLTVCAGHANAPFGWSHGLWTQSGLVESKLPARYYDKQGAETLRWLNTVVVPSIKKAADNGLIDLHAWLDTHFPGILP